MQLVNTVIRRRGPELVRQDRTGDVVAVEDAKARLDAACSVLITARDTVTVARRRLERLTQARVGLLSVSDPGTRGPIPDRMRPWVAMALRNPPLLKEAETQLRVARTKGHVDRRAVHR